jgi:hypothetical protein
MPLGRSRKEKVGMKLNGTHQLLGYTDDVNILGDNIDTIKKKHKHFNCCSVQTSYVSCTESPVHVLSLRLFIQRIRPNPRFL